MKFIEKVLFVSACTVFAAVCFTGSATAQGRDRVVKTTASQPTNLPSAPVKVEKTTSSLPVLTNDIVVVKPPTPVTPLVKKTGSSAPVNVPAAMAAAGRTAYGPATSIKLDQAIKNRAAGSANTRPLTDARAVHATTNR